MSRRSISSADFVWYAAGTALVIWFKRFAGGAGAEELRWLLDPSCALAELVTGITFIRETGVGWISHSHRMVVGVSCAGTNFLAISFSAIYFSFLHRRRGNRERLLWLARSLLIGYALTVGMNGVRIGIATAAHGSTLHLPFLSPEGLHRIIGLLLFGTVLPAVFVALERSSRAHSSKPRALRLVLPAGWYLLFTLAIPVLRNPSIVGDERFWVHASTIAGVLAVLAAVIASITAKTGRVPRGRCPAREKRCLSPDCPGPHLGVS